MAFRAWEAQLELSKQIAALEPFNLGLFPTAESLEGRANYISDVTKLVAAHIEAMAADAACSTNEADIDEEHARIICDVGSDIAGQIQRAADLTAVA